MVRRAAYDHHQPTRPYPILTLLLYHLHPLSECGIGRRAARIVR